MSARNNPTKCQNTALLMVDIKIWIDFYVLTKREKNTLKLGCKLVDFSTSPLEICRLMAN
jgi:hypothetical protein